MLLEFGNHHTLNGIIELEHIFFGERPALNRVERPRFQVHCYESMTLRRGAAKLSFAASSKPTPSETIQKRQVPA